LARDLGAAPSLGVHHRHCHRQRLEAAMSHAELIDALISALGADAVRTDAETLGLMASDVHVTGVLPAAVVRPVDARGVAAAIAAATSRGYAVLPRGGGLSY